MRTRTEVHTMLVSLSGADSSRPSYFHTRLLILFKHEYGLIIYKSDTDLFANNSELLRARTLHLSIFFSAFYIHRLLYIRQATASSDSVMASRGCHRYKFRSVNKIYVPEKMFMFAFL